MPETLLHASGDSIPATFADDLTPMQSSALDKSLAGTPPMPPLSDQVAASTISVRPPPQPDWPHKSASLQSEYVSGGGYLFLANYLRSLPHYIDDTTRDLGDDLYDRMMLDPQVNSAIRLLKLAALSNGIRLEPAIDIDNDEEEMDGDPEQVYENNQPRDEWGQYRTKTNEELIATKEGEAEDARKQQVQIEAKLAQEICDFCAKCLDNLERPLLDVVYEMLDALVFGNKVAEQNYELTDSDDGKKRLVLKSLKVKPRTSTAFVVDAYMNLTGLLAIIPGIGQLVYTGSIIGDPTKIPNLLPREKFAILTWASQNGDPRGTSLLRAVYNSWWSKMMAIASYNRYLAMFASPSVIATVSEKAMAEPQRDSLGNVIPGGMMITPEQAMMQALIGFKNESLIAVPAGSTVTTVTVPPNSAFKDALAQFDGDISKGILCQTLATEEGVHQARAASETHQDVLDLVVHHVKQVVGSMIRKDILYQLVRYNWGEEAAKRFTPKVHLAQVQMHNWSKDASAVASLVAAQYLDPSQWREMDARLGLPKRKSIPDAMPTPQGKYGPGKPGAAPGGMPGAAPVDPNNPNANAGGDVNSTKPDMLSRVINKSKTKRLLNKPLMPTDMPNP